MASSLPSHAACSCTGKTKTKTTPNVYTLTRVRQYTCIHVCTVLVTSNVHKLHVHTNTNKLLPVPGYPVPGYPRVYRYSTNPSFPPPMLSKVLVLLFVICYCYCYRVYVILYTYIHSCTCNIYCTRYVCSMYVCM